MGTGRKVRIYSDSLAIRIPVKIAELHTVKGGHFIEFEPIGSEEFKINRDMILPF